MISSPRRKPAAFAEPAEASWTCQTPHRKTVIHANAHQAGVATLPHRAKEYIHLVGDNKAVAQALNTVVDHVLVHPRQPSSPAVASSKTSLTNRATTQSPSRTTSLLASKTKRPPSHSAPKQPRR